MSLITRQITAMFGGVSQQPATLRLPSQSEAEVNIYSDVATGASRRPPSEHINVVATTDLTGACLHSINRDNEEQYTVVVTNGGLAVYDKAGTAKTVTAPNGVGYLSVPSGKTASDVFRIVTVADYSFVVNTSVTAATEVSTSSPPSGITNAVLVGGTSFANLVTTNTGTSGYYITVSGTYKGQKQVFTDLALLTGADAPTQGDVWKILAGTEANAGAYYVIRNNNQWEETVLPADAITFNAATMPHVLVRNSDGTFTFTTFAWVRRMVGDLHSNPTPSFVGSTISDVFFHKNRLGFLTGSGVVFSCAGDYNNFWRNSVTQLLDSDVVDVTASTLGSKVSKLHYAVPFNNSLMLFAEQSQFRLNVDQLLTPTSASLDTSTEFEMSTKCRPIGIGSYAYFVSEFGDYSKVHEYYVDNTQLNNDANDITAHVPKYIPKNLIKLTGSSANSALFAVSKDAPNRIYVYQYFWGQQDKIQSAWKYWEFPSDCTVLSVSCMKNYLYVLMQRKTSDSAVAVSLEKINLQQGATTGNVGYQICLDRLCNPSSVTWNSSLGTTTVVLPYSVPYADQKSLTAVVIGQLADGSQNTGGTLMRLVAANPWTSDSSFTMYGNYSGYKLWVGQRYSSTYTFSQQFAMANNKAITTGRLMLRTFTIQYSNTAFFKTSVAPFGLDAEVESVIPSKLADFTGKTVGDSYLSLGSPTYTSGYYPFQIYGDARVARISLFSDSHMQFTFQSVEWEGLYHNRASASP